MEQEPLLGETPEIGGLAVEPTTLLVYGILGYIGYKIASNFAKKHNL